MALRYLIMFGASLFWAAGFIAMGEILKSINATSLLFFRYLIVIIVLLPLIWKTDRFELPTKANILPIIGMALFNVLLMNLLMFEAYKTTTGTNISIISALNPLTISFWSFLILKTRFKAIQILGAIIAFLGVILMVFKGNMEAILSLNFHKGDLLMIMAVFSFGLSAICSRLATKTITPLNALLYSSIIALIVFLPFGYSKIQWPEWNMKLTLLVLLVGIISTAAAQWFFNISIKKLGAAESGIIINFNPVFGMFISMMFLSEVPVWGQLLGWFIIMLGALMFYEKFTFKTVNNK